jgi:transcriptional repressor NrdR
MICPFCNANKDKVIDSRSTEAGQVIRRRRHCLACDKRFTTYERVEQSARLTVIKKDGTRVPFDAERVMQGVKAACGKRPISEGDKVDLVAIVEEELHREFDREVASKIIGERVMSHLRALDPVAYIRFATEHLGLATIDDVRAELEDLNRRPPEAKEQQPLFTNG